MSLFNSKKSVTSLEMELREKLGLAPSSPHVSRVKACIEFLASLSSIIPVIAPALDILRQEFENAIYSNSLTNSNSTEIGNSDTLDRIPWFVLVSRVGDIRQMEIIQSRDTIADLQYKVKVRERDIVLLQKRIIALKQDFQSSQEETTALLDKISRYEIQIKSKTLEKEELKLFYQSKIEQAFREKDALELNLAQANSTIEKLSVFKSKNDEHASVDQAPSSLWINEKKTMVVPEPVQITQIAINEAELLMHQFYDITNSQLDELETSLLQLRKRQEILGTFSEEDTKKLNSIISEYKPSMQQLLSEQELLTTHIEGLRQALANHQESKDFIEWKKYAQETQRKYSVSLHYSTDGKVFDPYPNSFFCGKCGESTLICPHQQQPSITQPFTVRLPPSTTHIQLRRPLLRIHIPPRLTLNDQTMIPEEDHASYVDKKISEASEFFRSIWHFYFNKANGKKPVLPRVFGMDQLHFFISDLYDNRWIYEQSFVTNPCSFMEYLLIFISERYYIKEIVLRVAFEILSSLEFFQDANNTIHLFIRQLSGHDTANWKYLRLVHALLQPIPHYDATSYKSFVRMLYPSRGDMLYEQLELEHFGSASITSIHVDVIKEHLKMLLRKKKEPNVRAFTGLLNKFDTAKCGFLSEQQFKDCLMELLPQSSTDLAHQQYKVAQHVCLPNKVPIDRLGQVIAYLFAHLCLQVRSNNTDSEDSTSETPQLKYLIDDLEPYSNLESP
ncbi:hypothetical protein HMI54_015023 [Coelomomyces lativittatus]|nr:hypothetical protein HMI54_015023 [Coelomomyces lativittatus]KAJ1513756.1 hypothetical protein HMI56_001821 [Coelomomyces lativittatus]KAJ1516056.1 hypothetical protein HMI55_003070 [Coelomomyces lativittatus]